MPEGSVSKYDSEGSKTWSNTVQYEYDYTIDAPVREEIPFSLAPAPGSTLPILNALNLDVIPGTEVAGLSFKSNFWKNLQGWRGRIWQFQLQEAGRKGKRTYILFHRFMHSADC